MKPTLCRMCGEKFEPIGTEHICEACLEEVAETERNLFYEEEEQERNEQPTETEPAALNPT